jgi:hypothetical protein
MNFYMEGYLFIALAGCKAAAKDPLASSKEKEAIQTAIWSAFLFEANIDTMPTGRSFRNGGRLWRSS